MNRSTTLLLSACALPLALALATPKTSVSFAPSEGSSLKKVFTNEVDLTLDEMNITMNGEDSPMPMEMDMNVVSTTQMTVSDEYVAMGDGVPTTLKRSYDELTATTAMSMEISVMGNDQSQEEDLDSSSELEGESVIFQWNKENGGFQASFPEDAEGDEELLVGLKEDMDLRSLLPDGDVSEGDTWEISVGGLYEVLAPGGDVKLVPDDMSQQMQQMSGGMNGMGNMQEWIQDEIEGTAGGTFVGMRDLDGQQMALIEVTLDINTAVDMTDKVMESMDEMEMPEGAEIEFDHLDLEFTMEGKGQLFWNIKGGHFHSFEISGSTGIVVDSGMAMNMGGQEMTIEYSMEMSGSITMGATAE